MGKVVGFEMNSQDPEKAIQFYRDVFGWEVSGPSWDYWEVTAGKSGDSLGLNGGISKGPHDFPHGTRLQIEVGSIDDTIAKALENGAMVVRGKMAFDSFYMAYLVDSTGIGFGLIEKK